MPHHHYDSMPVEISSHYEYDNSHSHHSGDKHHHESPVHNEQNNPTKPQHDHDFPKHNHISETYDFYFRQLNRIISLKQIRQTIIIIFSGTLFSYFDTPPDIKNRCSKFLPLITSFFEPGTIALRGPPAV